MSNPPGQLPTDPNQPPDVQAQTPPAPVPDTGSMQGQPTPPAKETFKQGFARGGAGEQYVVDAQGNMTNARTSAPSSKGNFGSILAGAVMGALAGAHSARPGGIPSKELGGGGAGQGAAGAQDFFQKRDELRRQQAQTNFQNRQAAQKAQDEDLTYKADLHIKILQALQMAHDLGTAQREDPFRLQQLKNAAEESSFTLDTNAKELGLINERTYKDYVDVPKADIDKFNRHQVKLVALPDGSIKVWDRTFDARTTPNG